ncbi:hypothetical protein CASFOL_005850 [Castilleja foliolosa]|uniref:Uncharacterized protein n=1 Tax=Castilleja foliolosa TaxID=1961234 RepID=A0ABD3E6N0_9LAMI
MAIMRRSFTFMAGTLVGAYIAQNYNLPHVSKLFKAGFVVAKHVEATYRKPNNTRAEDNINEE